MANMYYCSDGARVSEATITSRYSASLKKKHAGQTVFVCEGCGAQAVHNDHTIARRRCKEIHKAELIWHQSNYVSSCAKCHREWENFKSGDWCSHNNASERLRFLREHDLEGFNIRVELTTHALSLNATP